MTHWIQNAIVYDSCDSFAEIIGYESEAAPLRVFKTFAAAPVMWRPPT